LLVDEIEAHLHPRWQRTILRSLLKVMQTLESKPKVQLLAATHSPLVLASLEPLFEQTRDRLWSFNLIEGEARIEQAEFHPHGSVNDWLRTIFQLGLAGSREAEIAELLINAVFQSPAPTDEQVNEADDALRKARLAPGTALGARWALFKRERAASR
jgi:hypothetical protein